MDIPECSGCRQRDARIAELEARVLATEAHVRDLLDKLKPPAPRVVTPQPPAPAKKPTGKTPGAQPGHPPQMKMLVPPERVNEVVPYIPQRCAKCDKSLPAAPGAKDSEDNTIRLNAMVVKNFRTGRFGGIGNASWQQSRPASTGFSLGMS